MYPSPFEDIPEMALIGSVGVGPLKKPKVTLEAARNDEAEISHIPVAYACEPTCSGPTQIKIGRNHIEMSAVLYLSIEEIVA
ncbi:hypothetical protein I7I51_00560 [Histoplasma capsulatum]|uniref:Uncharacterized protein n=1 Tax=Ajellomyces capsulatus TaxID=5037 RepID=A0A8A1MG18_AJECA|nr:predicted protein [Histoplasma mississippiense (nom. inval.)]EDN08900.1 predicted protein [Histoplasma mississippiense (nom. inval.)]QSS63502.1 hypothetical protein I7I51_00560 [Histoplasma capsulatum]